MSEIRTWRDRIRLLDLVEDQYKELKLGEEYVPHGRAVVEARIERWGKSLVAKMHHWDLKPWERSILLHAHDAHGSASIWPRPLEFFHMLRCMTIVTTKEQEDALYSFPIGE